MPTMQVTGTTRMYPDRTDTTDGATTTQASSSLHVSATVGKAVRVVGIDILIAPGADADITLADHAGTAYVGKVYSIDSTQACPFQIWVDDALGNGLSVIIETGGGAMVAAVRWENLV